MYISHHVLNYILLSFICLGNHTGTMSLPLKIFSHQRNIIFSPSQTAYNVNGRHLQHTYPTTEEYYSGDSDDNMIEDRSSKGFKWELRKKNKNIRWLKHMLKKCMRVKLNWIRRSDESEKMTENEVFHRVVDFFTDFDRETSTTQPNITNTNKIQPNILNSKHLYNTIRYSKPIPSSITITTAAPTRKNHPPITQRKWPFPAHPRAFAPNQTTLFPSQSNPPSRFSEKAPNQSQINENEDRGQRRNESGNYGRHQHSAGKCEDRAKWRAAADVIRRTGTYGNHGGSTLSQQTEVLKQKPPSSKTEATHLNSSKESSKAFLPPIEPAAANTKDKISDVLYSNVNPKWKYGLNLVSSSMLVSDR